MPRKLIIDTDPGVDDALAIALAFESPDIELLGLSTIYGNAEVETTTLNALRLVEYSGQDIPVARGAAKPSVVASRPPPDFVHGADGCGEINLPPPSSREIDLPAAEWIVETAKAHPGEVSILALGGLTNLADALALEPELDRLIHEVVLMGGCLYCPGNVSPVAEANISEDPHAADTVFGARWPVTMVGLDTTLNVILERARLDRIRDDNTRFGPLVHAMHQFYINFYSQQFPDADGCPIHDATALMYLLHPELFKTCKGPLRVAVEGIAIGQTILARNDYQKSLAPWKGRPEVTVTLGADCEGYFRCFDEILLGQ